MSRTTTALVVPELNGKFQLQEVYLNDIQPDEVLVEIVASGLCHTDLSCAAGLLPCSPNAVLGHEGAGIVLNPGSSSTDLSPGDLVLLSFSHCGSCPQCLSSHPAYCHSFNARNFGGTRPDGSPSTLTSPPSNPSSAPMHSSFFGQSSFAKQTLVHKSSCVKVPPGTDLKLFSPLGCGLQTGAGAVLNTLDIPSGSTIAIFGVGSVGMAAVMAAGLICKAKTVIAIDLQQSRLDLAKELGATHGVLGNAKDVVQQIRELCKPNLGVDYAVDCTGVPAVVKTMIDALGSRGRAATVGAPGPGHCVSVDIMGQLTFGKEYVGCSEGDSLPRVFIPYLMEMHAKGLFPLERFVEYYDVKDFEKAIEDAKSGKTIKPVLTWSSIQ